MERHIYECCPRATIEIKNGLTAKVLTCDHPHYDESIEPQDENNNNIPAVANRNYSRKRAPIWQYFENDGDHATLRLKRRCRCCFCHDVMQSQPKRMERHLLRTCTRVPSDVLQDYRQTIHEEEMKKTLACVPEGESSKDRKNRKARENRQRKKMDSKKGQEHRLPIQ